jgi:hypothetical protein
MRRFLLALLTTAVLVTPALAGRSCQEIPFTKHADQAYCLLTIDGKTVIDDPCALGISGDGREFDVSANPHRPDRHHVHYFQQEYAPHSWTSGKVRATVGLDYTGPYSDHYDATWNRGHGNKMVSVGKVKWIVDKTDTSVHFSGHRFDLVISGFQFCIDDKDSNQDLIDRVPFAPEGAASDMLTGELWARDCRFNEHKGTWACKDGAHD